MGRRHIEGSRSIYRMYVKKLESTLSSDAIFGAAKVVVGASSFDSLTT